MTGPDQTAEQAAARAAFEARLEMLGLAELPAFEIERLWRAHLQQRRISADYAARLRPQDEGALLLSAEGIERS
jgi:hypothetical protein